MVLFGDGFEGEGFFAFVGAKGEAVADGTGLKFGKAVVVGEIDLQPLIIVFDDDASALERLGCANDDFFEDLGQFRAGWLRGRMKGRWRLAFIEFVDTIDEELVEMDV